MTMKRSREREVELESITTMASYLISLSRGVNIPVATHHDELMPNRVFECKTCNRQFQSFQALGGHRASHKKPKLSATDHVDLDDQMVQNSSSAPKPKTHECSICGLEFAIGQALGGHMRRHRAHVYGTNDHDHDQKQHEKPLLSLSLASAQVPVVNKPISRGRRVLCLDLNLTPLENLEVGKLAPIFG
ncbi:hypothetical protein Ancab_023434 [Ancistrocladus abbreviatus]